MVVTVIAYDFYLLRKGKELQLFDGKKGTLLDMMYPKADDVKKYMHRKKLKVSNRSDLIQIINFYNSFQ